MTNNDFVIENGVLSKYIGKGGDVVIPDCVTEIGREAFAWCSGLKSVVVPESVTRIGYGAFEHSNVESVVVRNGVTEIDSCAFLECIYLVNITLPASIRSIGYKAFLIHYHVPSLKERRTIYAPTGSYAEQYANNEDILFVAE